MMAIMIDAPREGYPAGRYAVQELARDGMLLVRNWERVALTYDDSGEVVAYAYTEPKE